MKLCICEACRYTFRSPVLPLSCPDCGKGAVRTATPNEAQEFLRLQKMLEEDIRLGLWERMPCAPC